MYAYNYIYIMFSQSPQTSNHLSPTATTAPGVAGRRFRRGAGEKCHPAGSEKLPGSPVVCFVAVERPSGGGPEMQKCKLTFWGKHPENVG